MSWSDEAFTAVYDELSPGLCRYVEGLLGRTGAAQEVVQETFVRLYRLGAGHVAPGEERFWTYRVASNLALNELRRGRTRARLLDRVAAVLRRRQPDPLDEAERAERAGVVRAALERLPDAQRAALLLRECEGLTYAEIAGVLGVSLAKVKVDIFRARSALREELIRVDPR